MNSRRAAVVAVIILILLASALFCVRSYNERFHESEGQSEIGLLVGEQLTEDGFPNESSRLWVYGNANEDDVIDDADVSYLLGVLSGDNPETVLSDANCDGVVDSDDIVYVERLISEDEMEVFYVDNYYRIASVSWPVERIAIGYCSGAYVADLTGLTGKVVLVDETIRDYWSSMSSSFRDAGCFGATEAPNYETMIAADIDVYVVGSYPHRTTAVSTSPTRTSIVRC